MHGVGLLHGVTFTSMDRAARFQTECLGQGLLLSAPTDRTVVISPALIIGENDVRLGVDMMAEVLLGWADPA